VTPKFRRSAMLVVMVMVMSAILSACGADPTATPIAAPTATTAASNPTATTAVSEPTATEVATDPTATTMASNPTAKPTAPAELRTVRLGYIAVMIFAPIYVGIERGYFAEEGLKLELTPLQGGSDSVVQLAAGNFDVAVGGAGAGLFNAANSGIEFKIVAPMHSEKPPLTTPLVISAKRKDELKTVADLKGKKVAINATGAATEYWLSEALKKNGMTFDDIQLTSLAFRDVPAALESGSLDASMLGEPLVTTNVDQGIVSILANDFINGFTATYLYMGAPFMQDNPEAAQGFMRAYLKACRDLQGDYLKDDPEIATIVEKYTQVPADVVARAAAPQYNADGVVPMADLETLQEFFIARGELQYTEPLDLSGFVDVSVAEQAVEDLKTP
jgi:NitT/TauT family transport system substrate-binding protein